MSNPLTAAGAVGQPSKWGAIHTNRFITGLWTQRSLLRDAATPYLMEKFYSGSRFDSLLDGLNMELSTKLTLRRRRGHSVYNNQNFPPISRYYAFKNFNAQVESIRVMADTAATVYDATGPSTKTAILTKSAGAGTTSFQSVGNTLFMGNGVDLKKWVNSLIVWAQSKTLSVGTFIVDTNFNLQQISAIIATITSVQVTNGVCTIQAANNYTVGQTVVLPASMAATFLNGQSVTITAATSTQFSFSFANPNYGPTADSGTAISTSGSGVTGSGVQPTWATSLTNTTNDGTLRWTCKGSAVQNWGIATPTVQPTVVNSAIPSPYPSWTTGGLVFYSPSLLMVDPANNLQKLTGLSGANKTAAAPPVFATTPGATTTDGDAVWTCIGGIARQTNHTYSINDCVVVTYNVKVRVIVDYIGSRPIYGYDIQTFTNFFMATTITGPSSAGADGTISWATGRGQTTQDGGVTWTNEGSVIYRSSGSGGLVIGNLAILSLNTQILDNNGNLENVLYAGFSGSVAPTWATKQGASTVDGTVTWTNAGPAPTSPNTGSWTYGCAFKNGVTKHVSTLSPLSNPITLASNSIVSLQANGSTDPQVDTIQIYRTAQGGSLLLLLDEIPNPVGGGTWAYYDNQPDTSLDVLTTAPINDSNDPPPAGAVALIYHLSRIFVAVNNTVYFSGGPDTLVGSGNEAFPPANNFVFPSAVIRLVPTSIGLLVYTISDIYIIAGLGTSGSPLYSAPFIVGYGISNYDALAVNGSTIYAMTSDVQVVSFDPGAGILEVGFPIGDLLESTFNPATAQVTWHMAGSTDKGLYVADGATGWYRMSPTSPPESGLVWSPKATIAGGCSAVRSLETTPGVRNLLVGPATNGPILKRDKTTNRDNAVSFSAFATIGNIVLAQPGQVAEVMCIVVDSPRVGTAPTLGVLLDEISGTFEPLTSNCPDPPRLPASSTLFNNRYYLSQAQNPSFCRHLQVKFTFPSEDATNEIFTYTIVGAVINEKRR